MRDRRITAYFSGYVQGVGFRFTTVHIARRFQKIGGYVRNLPDGRVELVAEGPEEDVERFVAQVRKEMSSYIRSADLTRTQATGEFAGFSIKW